MASAASAATRAAVQWLSTKKKSPWADVCWPLTLTHTHTAEDDTLANALLSFFSKLTLCLSGTCALYSFHSVGRQFEPALPLQVSWLLCAIWMRAPKKLERQSGSRCSKKKKTLKYTSKTVAKDKKSFSILLWHLNFNFNKQCKRHTNKPQ